MRLIISFLFMLTLLSCAAPSIAEETIRPQVLVITECGSIAVVTTAYFSGPRIGDVATVYNNKHLSREENKELMQAYLYSLSTLYDVELSILPLELVYGRQCA